VFPTRNNHHDRSEATLAFLSCLNGPRSVKKNLDSVSFLSLLGDEDPPSARWKCEKSGALVFGRISKPGGKSGKLALAF
jgi:hypothetical protein